MVSFNRKYGIEKAQVSDKRRGFLFLSITEFDNPSFGYSDNPAAYGNAYKALVTSCGKRVRKCREKVSFVWHSWAAPKVASLKDFYPGDDVVDWVGVSIFKQFYPWYNTAGAFSGGSGDDLREVLDFAKLHGKPIMIAESAPFGGILIDKIKLVRYNLAELDVWDLWFQPTLDLIDEYDIGMWSYINCDWTSQPMWAGIGFGDTRLVASMDVMKHWWEKVLQNPRFVNKLDCHPNRNHASPSSVMQLSAASMRMPDETSPLSRFVPVVYLVVAALAVFSTYKLRRSRKQNDYEAIEESDDVAEKVTKGHGVMVQTQASLEEPEREVEGSGWW
jgi:hypothetical protein